MIRSPFRPVELPDPTILDEHRTLIQAIERRGFLSGGLSLGALTFLTGCDVSDKTAIGKVLHGMSSFNDRAQQALFNPNALAPTFSKSMVQQPPRFNAYYDIEDVKPVDGKNWRLELAGLIQDRRAWTKQQIDGLPVRDMVVRHVCVEGWDYIGEWSGIPLGDFLRRVGADLTAKYVAFKTADNYPSSIDMASALHPQTLLVTKYAGEPIPDPYGFPLRLKTPIKLGFKQPKWITAIEVSNTYSGGYWENQGFNWFSGL